MSHRPPRLLPWPNPFRKENPYHRLLCEGLQRHGIRLMTVPPMFFPLRYLPAPDWLHLFWTEQLYAAPDLHTRAMQFERFMETLRKLKARGVRILWTLNNEHPHEVEDAAGIAFYRQAYARLMEASDLIHVHFPAAVEYVTREYQVDARKIVVVPHGHYAGYYGDPMPKAEARARFGIPSDAVVLLNLGYLRRYKGIEEAMAAFADTKDPRLRFLIAGEPANAEIAGYCDAERRKNPRLVMRLSKLKNRDFVPLLSAADAFLFPSRNFFTSGSVMLALTYGLPFVAVPRHHTLQFLGRSFFRPWQPADRATLTTIMDGMAEWLPTVDRTDLAATRTEFDPVILTAPLARRLSET